jgi:two-component system, OmpR family, alkaline phosphatase synthesis response regulator PhoP
MRILIADDSVVSRHLLDATLRKWGYEVVVACDGVEAWNVLQAADAPQLAILDWVMPGLTGPEVCRRVREHTKGRESYTYILLLTSKSLKEDLIEGMEAGADDYLTKPFELSILIARIRGLLRRREWLRAAVKPSPQAAEPAQEEALPDLPADSTQTFTFGDKSVDFDRLELRVREQVFPLTLMEANVLRYLVESEGKRVSRKAMLANVWGLHEDTDTRAIDNFIVRLRRYIEDDPTRPRHLQTVRGVGYRFVASPEE